MDSLHCALRLAWLYPYPLFTLRRLCKGICGLTAQRKVCAGPSGLLQADGHVGRDRRVTVQYPRKGMTGNSQNLRCLGNAEAKRVQALQPDAAIWMGRILLGIVSPFQLVVIDEINVVRVASFKPKGGPPVASNRNAPQPLRSPLSRWSLYPGRSRSLGGYPSGAVSLIEPPQPSMAKRTDYRLAIPCSGTAINECAKLPHTDT